MNSSSGRGATADYFSTLGDMQTQKALQIFNTAKYNPVQQPAAAKALRDETVSYYQSLLGDSSDPLSETQSQPDIIRDPKLMELMKKVTQSKLSFADKKTFLDELLDEYNKKTPDKRAAFLLDGQKLLAEAEAKAKGDGKMSKEQTQMLNLYIAQMAAGTSNTGRTSLMDFLG